MQATLKLEPTYYQAALKFTEDLSEAYRKRGRTDHFYGQGAPTSEAANLRGSVAEAGLCQYLGIPYEPEVMDADGGDGGVDVEWRGLSIQVKATLHERGGLIYDDPKLVRADLTVLTVLYTHKTQRIAGWISSPEYLRLAYWREFERGKKLYLPQAKLRPMQEFSLKAA